MTQWAPMFQLQIGVGRGDLLEMTIPEMVDMIDYASEMRGRNA